MHKNTDFSSVQFSVCPVGGRLQFDPCPGHKKTIKMGPAASLIGTLHQGLDLKESDVKNTFHVFCSGTINGI